MIKTGWNLENSYVNLPQALYTNQSPDSVTSPELVILNYSLAEAIGLDVQELKSKEGINLLSGNKLPEASIPIAQAYAGHQFGYFTKLGDGRAVLLGEQITPNEERFDIQLKGSGITPYSRGGDGRAALGPMLREYIISEAMQGLGIPTTRSLAVVTTGEKVFREKEEIGAVLTRVAASHIRVGTFQYAAHFCNINTVKSLADYTINRHYPKIKLDENVYLTFLKEVIRRQAELIAKWQLVGFIHGVMNTDNMAISGETIDYGPCAFMDVYDPATVFSSIDHKGRYAYKNQPSMAAWNLARFAETILPLLHKDEAKAIALAKEEISEFSTIYHNTWLNGMRTKLGIFNKEEEDEELIVELLNLMQKYKADYTNTFIALTFEKEIELFDSKELEQWKEKWQSRLSRQKESKSEVVQLMKNSNPVVIPRNFRVEEALDAAVKSKDYSIMYKLLQVLAKPYSHTSEQEEYAKLPPASSCKYKTFCGT